MSIKRTPELTAHFEAEYRSARLTCTREAYVGSRYRLLEQREAAKATPVRGLEPAFKW